MKRLILFFLTVFFIFGLSTTIIAENIPEEEMAELTTTEASDYDLPYPGMLPDHPLYKIKTLRNKIILFLIRDPLKKAAKHLEMADKELFSALKLAEKDKIALAQHTAFKAEHHMTLLVTEIKKAVYYSNKEFPQDLAQRAYQAALKHQELLAGIMSKANGETKEAFTIIQKFSTRNDDELSRLEKEIEAKNLEPYTPLSPNSH